MQNSSKPTATTLETKSDECINLKIKRISLGDHAIHVPRNASVLHLKERIQTELDVDKQLQRLIFLGKVLQDDKILAEYDRLANGSTIHLVIKDADAPRNPANDQPNTHARHHSIRDGLGGFPMIEVVTVSSTFSDFTPSTFSNLSMSSPSNRRASQLARAATMINQLQQMLDRPDDVSDVTMRDAEDRPASDTSTSNPNAELATVLDNLATLMETVAPRLRDLRGPITSRTETTSVEQMAEVIDNLAVANHFVYSLLSSLPSETTRRGNPFSGNPFHARPRSHRTRSSLTTPVTLPRPSTSTPTTARPPSTTTTSSSSSSTAAANQPDAATDDTASQKRKLQESTDEHSGESSSSAAATKRTKPDEMENGKGKEKED